MRKKFFPTAWMAFPVLLTFACASAGVASDPAMKNWPQREIIARTLPEVAVECADRSVERAKVLRMQGKELTVLPYPYWNVDPLKIDGEQILSIRLFKKRSKIVAISTSAFAIGFAGFGLVTAAASRYDEDYQSGLALAVLAGFSAGVLGLIIGGASQLSSRSHWNLSGSSTGQRLKVLSEIMGVRL